MTLLELSHGKEARILGFSGGEEIQKKLKQYGIFAGDRIKVLRSAPFEGPTLLSINGREIALGRGIAAKIQVEVEG